MPSKHWLLVLLLAAPSLSHAQDAEKAKAFDATLRQLEKEIAEVRGLAFKTPVVAKIIARPKEAAKGIQGFYSTKDKALTLYDDIQGNYERGVLIHEMVHALQDQHFGLAKLHQTEFGSDAELALAALIEGDATFTMIELLKKDQPKVAAMLDTSLEKAKNLKNAFLYGVGARYVKGLKERGGWASVNARYKFPPRTTAAILQAEPHGTIDLGPGRSVGAFGLALMMADHPEAKGLALSAAQGWIGDRVVEDGAVKSWQLAFDNATHATRYKEAYAAFLSGSRPQLKLFANAAGPQWWDGNDGTKLTVTVRGSRVNIVEAPSEAAHRAAVERLEGPPELRIWSAKDRRLVSFGEMVDKLLEADLVCIGEKHDSEPCHRVQFQIIKALHARDARLGVGMEMFQRQVQDHLDHFADGKIDEEAMLKGTEYRSRWGYHWSLYQPIAEFCKRNRLPVAALNVPRELTSRLSKVGHAQLSEEEKKQLGPIDFHVKAHRDHWYESLAKMHGNVKTSEDQKERSYQVMTAWDEYMAASAAAFQQLRQLRRMVVLAGSGHIDHGFGIPNRAAQRTGGRAATVHIAPGGDPSLFNNPVADFVVLVK
jgi:uncharacterized iron-regulated protein